MALTIKDLLFVPTLYTLALQAIYNFKNLLNDNHVI